MNDFSKFMNVPGHSIFPPTDMNIVKEYSMRQDIGSVAKVFGIAKSNVRSVLKKEGISIIKKSELD